MSSMGVGVLLVGIGGAFGAMARHAVGLLIEGREAILVVNAVGSFLLGGILAAPFGNVALLAIGVGFCGAFTTFSSFAIETVTTAEGGEHGTATWFAITNAVAAILALLFGAVGAGIVW